MKFNPISRRYFLQGTGGAILALPVLESLVPRAFAAPAPLSATRRFICVCQANGIYRPDWNPPTSNSTKMTKIGNTHREMKLTDVTGPVAGAVSQIIGTEFAGLRDKLLLLQNLTSFFPNLRGHQMATVLAGNIGRGHPGLWANNPDPKYFGPSIDQVLANSSKIYSSEPRTRALHLRTGLNDSEPEIDLSWDYRNGNMELPTQYTQPVNAFNAIFKTSLPVGDAQQQKENQLVDQVLEQYKALRNNSRTTASDKAILDDHMSMVAQLQKTVQSVSCTTPAPTKTYNTWTAQDREPMLDAYIQLLVAAIKCGATRIGTLTLSRGVDSINFDPVLGTSTGGDWHDFGHSSAGEASSSMRTVHKFHARKVADLLNQLNVAEPGTNGTYLDNCIVYWGNEQGGHTDHEYTNRPVLIAGSGGGVLQTNKLIDYSVVTRGAEDYNRLLVTFLQAMGLAQTDYFTAEMQAKGIKPGFGDDRGSDANRANPLPGVLVGG
ncbi:MAG: DUF1552 domain-containing protein [Bdellovibrionales bacterium]